MGLRTAFLLILSTTEHRVIHIKYWKIVFTPLLNVPAFLPLQILLKHLQEFYPLSPWQQQSN